MSHARLEVRMESLAPFLQGTCTPYNMPVYPGAQCINRRITHRETAKRAKQGSQ